MACSCWPKERAHAAFSIYQLMEATRVNGLLGVQVSGLILWDQIIQATRQHQHQHQHSHQHQLNGDSAPLPDIKATFTTYTTTRRPHLQEQYASHLVAERNAGGDFRRQCVCFRTERQGKHLLQQRGPHPCDVAIEVPTPAPTPSPAPAQDRQWLLWPWNPQHLQYQWSRW